MESTRAAGRIHLVQYQDHSPRYHHKRFDLARYKSIADGMRFSAEREHTDGLCCFLPSDWQTSDKRTNHRMYLIHGIIHPTQEISEVVYEQGAPSMRVGMEADAADVEALLAEFERRRDASPQHEEHIPEHERYRLEGNAFPACEHLGFNLSESGIAAMSCSIYDSRDGYCRVYPKYGTKPCDPYCVFDGWRIEISESNSSIPANGIQAKLLALDNSIYVPQRFVMERDAFQIGKVSYDIIPLPVPSGCDRISCLEHPKYRGSPPATGL